MYVPEQFAMTTSDAMAVVSAVGVGDFISYGERGIDATLLPFSLASNPDGSTSLHTHVARTNFQWHDEGSGMVIVHGPDSYISPTAMPEPDPRSRKPVVPTWNYVVVHLKGRIKAHHDDDWKLQSLYDLVEHHDPDWRIGDGEAREMVRRMLPAIVGLEFVIDEVIGKAKLSQNMGSDAIESTADHLMAFGHSQETAQAMRDIAIPYARKREERVSKFDIRGLPPR